MLVLLGCPGSTVVDVDPDSFDFQFVDTPHPNIAFFEDQFVINPRSHHAVILARCVHFDVLLDAVPAVVIQPWEAIVIPDPVVSIFASHVSVVTIEADGSATILLPLE